MVALIVLSSTTEYELTLTDPIFTALVVIKLEPVITTAVEAVFRPLDGMTPLTIATGASITVNWSEVLVADVPFAVVTVMWYVPDARPAGTTATISVFVLLVMVMPVDPILTLVAPLRLDPVMVTDVVVWFKPLDGEIPLTTGESGDTTVNSSAEEGVDEPVAFVTDIW